GCGEPEAMEPAATARTQPPPPSSGPRAAIPIDTRQPTTFLLQLPTLLSQAVLSMVVIVFFALMYLRHRADQANAYLTGYVTIAWAWLLLFYRWAIGSLLMLYRQQRDWCKVRAATVWKARGDR